MPWGNKPPDSKAGESCWDQRRAPPAPGQAQIRIIHHYTRCSSWAVLRTRSTGRTSHYCFHFRWGKGSAGTMKRVPRPRRPSQYRGRCNPVTLLHPEKPQHCPPTRINNPRAKLLKPFTHVTVAARGRWAEQPHAKCSSNTNHKNLCNLWLFISTCVRQASPSQETCSVIDQPNEETSLDLAQVKQRNVYCRKNSVSKAQK